MKEIKFRAWDKKTKSMFAVGGFHNMDYDLDSRFRYVTIAGGRTHPKMSATPSAIDIELMQFTGLRDKNHVEIYEGDIMQHGDLVAPVIFEDGRFAAIYHGPRSNIYDLLVGGEVIGNVYDDPGLLP